MKKFIPRPLYMKKIAPFMNKGVIKVIIGQRRVGKSYFMYQIIDALKKANLVQISFTSIKSSMNSTISKTIAILFSTSKNKNPEPAKTIF
jgi:predicted AAA+ superfamily ATPase